VRRARPLQSISFRWAAGSACAKVRHVLSLALSAFLRPVLLLPDGIAARLTSAQLHAILEHELCHVRRRDNLTPPAHARRGVSFWFHPLIWWIGARLIEERERACERRGCGRAG